MRAMGAGLPQEKRGDLDFSRRVQDEGYPDIRDKKEGSSQLPQMHSDKK